MTCAALQVGLTLPPVLAIRSLTNDDLATESYLPVVAAVIALLVAPAIAAAAAALHRPDAPVLHGAVVTTIGWAALTAVTVARLSRRAGGALDALAVLPLFALIEVGVGVSAAHVTSRWRGERKP